MSEQRWAIELDQAACIGSGVCAGVAPGVFTLREGKASAPGEVDADEAVFDAAECCPMGVIGLRSISTGARIFPEDG